MSNRPSCPASGTTSFIESTEATSRGIWHPFGIGDQRNDDASTYGRVFCTECWNLPMVKSDGTMVKHVAKVAANVTPPR